ncbi:nuclear transport factor 2 family protein [Kibdelosporangium aridum]|uniref:nuclear transport factor 2 family protein n=1 Tax=Kibdelosporangium aridum TaxID=2030 RepID=UPI0035E827C0
MTRRLVFLAVAVMASVLVPAGSAAGGALPGNVREFMRAYEKWGAAPTVEAYMDLFTSDATLMDSGLAAPIERPRIRAQIEAVLKVIPDFRFDPFTVTASRDGKIAFIEARNTGTVRGKTVSFTTTHRLVLDGSKVRQGRRFWDQTELFRPVAPELPNLFAGLEPADITEKRTGLREWAWNAEQPAALVAGTSLRGPGLTTPLSIRGAIAYLERLFGAVDFDLRAGHEVQQDGTSYLEWAGTAEIGGEYPRTVSFGIVERLKRNGEWTLSFDTLDMVASPARIAELRGLIFGL